MIAPYQTKTNPLYVGDVTEYPEDLIPFVDTFCHEFNFHAPARPRKNNPKGQYSYWVNSLWELQEACGEFGIKVIVEYRKDFLKYMREHRGLAPFPVCSPRSLVNMCRGKAAMMRDAMQPMLIEDKTSDFFARLAKEQTANVR